MKDLVLQLSPEQTLRAAVLIEMLDRCGDEPELAILLARDAAAWILGETIHLSASATAGRSEDIPSSTKSTVAEAATSRCAELNTASFSEVRGNRASDDAVETEPGAVAGSPLGVGVTSTASDGGENVAHARQHSNLIGGSEAVQLSAPAALPHLDELADDAGSSGCGTDRRSEGAPIDAPSESDEIDPSRVTLQQPSEQSEAPPQPAEPLGGIQQLPLDVVDAETPGNATKYKITSKIDEASPLVPAAVSARNDDATIRKMAESGATYEEIGVKIGKSAGYVRVRASELGLPKRAPGPQKGFMIPPPGTISHAERMVEAKERRQQLARMWLDGVPAGEIAKALHYSGASSVITTAVYHLKLPSRSKKAPAADAAAIEKHLAEKGVLTQPDFKDKDINVIYGPLRVRGHTLKRLPQGAKGNVWLLDSDSFGISKADLLVRARHIIENEKPLPGRQAAE